MAAAISSSVCTTAPPAFGKLAIIYSIISDAGVIGYAAINLEPAEIAPSPIASFPIIYKCGALSVATNSKSP